MANEKRLIWDEDAKRHLIALAVGHHTETLHIDMILNAILYHTTTVDAVEVVHGHWTSTGIFSKRAGYGVRYYQHAECEVAPCRLFECEHDYCPNCGAKMDGERKDNERKVY